MKYAYIIFFLIPVLSWISGEVRYKDIFISEHTALAQQVNEQHGIPITIILAQAALESDYGRSYSARHRCNYFGITGPDGNLKSYDNVDECFEHYGRIISGSRYKSCLEQGGLIDMVQCIHDNGYAVDTLYAEKLIVIMYEIMN